MNAVFVGHVCIDDNVSENASYKSWGSALMYMAHYFRDNFNVDPILISNYGKDFQAYLDNFRIIPAVPVAEASMVIENQTLNGCRRQRYLNAGNATPPAISDEVIEAVSTADIIIVAPLLPTYSHGYLRDLLSHKKDKSLTVLLPQGYFRSLGAGGVIEAAYFAEADEIIPMFDLVIFSEQDCSDPEQQAQKWAGHTGTKIVMTQGSGGASYITAQSTKKVATAPVPEEQIIDSVGCGDIFSAAVAHEYFIKGDVLSAIQEGNVAAGSKLVQSVSNNKRH